MFDGPGFLLPGALAPGLERRDCKETDQQEHLGKTDQRKKRVDQIIEYTVTLFMDFFQPLLVE